MINEKQKERIEKTVSDFCRSNRIEDAAIIYTEADREGCATVCIGPGEIIIMAIHSIVKKFSEVVDKDFVEVIQTLIEIEELDKNDPTEFEDFEVVEDE